MGKAIKYGLIGVVVLGVAYAFYAGIFSKDDAKQLGRSAYYKGRGAVGDLMEGPSPQSYEAANKCRENLRQIESAKRNAAGEKGQIEGALTVQEVERAFGAPFPVCPAGGRYVVGPLIQLPTCSKAEQGNIDPKDDHAIKKF